MTHLSAEARRLLETVGQADGPGAVHCVRLSRRLAATLAGRAQDLVAANVEWAAVAHAGGVTAKAGLSISKVVLWFVMGGGAGMVAAVPAAVWSHAAESAVSAASSSRGQGSLGVGSRPTASAPNNAPPRQEPALPNPAAIGPGLTSATPRPRAFIQPAPTSPRPDPGIQAELNDELRLLGAAQRELSAKRAEAALKLLDEHALRFPRAALVEEQLAARVLALCELGRVAEARDAAEGFLRNAPESPLVPRVHESCVYRANAGSLARPGSR